MVFSSKEGGALATASMDGVVKLWDVSTGQNLATLTVCCTFLFWLVFFFTLTISF